MPELSSILRSAQPFPASTYARPVPVPFLPTAAAAGAGVAAEEPIGLAAVYLGKVFRPTGLPGGQQGRRAQQGIW